MTSWLWPLVGAADNEVRERVGEVLHERVTARASRHLAEAGVDRADLRTDIATAVMLGVAMAYSAGVLEELARARPDEVVDLCTAAVQAVLAPEGGGDEPAGDEPEGASDRA